MVNSACISRPCGREVLDAARLAVDHAHDRPEDRAAGPELDGRVEHRAARRDDVFDDAQPRPVELAAFGEPAGAVGLRLLADEAGGQAAHLRHDRGERHAAELEAGERVDPGGHERDARRSAIARSSSGSDSNMYLSKYSWLTDARPQREGAGEVRGGVDPVGEAAGDPETWSIGPDGTASCPAEDRLQEA